MRSILQSVRLGGAHNVSAIVAIIFLLIFRVFVLVLFVTLIYLTFTVIV